MRVAYFLIFLCVFVNSLSADLGEHNPWLWQPTTRVLTRKNVSHLVVEKRPSHYRVTMLVSDRYPYSFKGSNFPFFIRFETEKEALDWTEKLDQYLVSGERFTIRLKGSEIVELLWGEP